MAKLKVHVANFNYDEINIINGSLYIKTKLFQMAGHEVKVNEIVSLNIATEDKVKKIGGTLGWGIVGGVLVGPLGMIAGALLGGNKKETTMIVELTNDRKFMATIPSDEYMKLISTTGIPNGDLSFKANQFELEHHNNSGSEFIKNDVNDAIDPLFEQAIIFIVNNNKKINITAMQKEFTIDEERAERILKQLELMSLISEPNAQGIRESLI